MKDSPDTTKQLLQRYLENACNPEEWEQVIRLLQENNSARILLQQMQDEFEQPQKFGELNHKKSAHIKSQLMQTITPATVIPIRRSWWKLAAAAIVFILAGASFYLYLNREQTHDREVVATETNPAVPDLEPGKNKAILTLGDGKKIDLDESSNGQLAAEGNTKILKGDGSLNYVSGQPDKSAIVFNTLATPRGGEYQLTLPDGTKVWLNAASSITYPTAFSGQQRRVEMTGEAYFEVAPNKSMPFIVKVDKAEVKVLGTHFNVMSYKDENVVKTTLLEGKVEFMHDGDIATLQPGQQSVLSSAGKLQTIENVDVEKIVAWKNGYFNFDGADIGTVLRQISRWYDVKLADNIESKEIFYGSVPRTMKLRAVLDALQMTGKVKFEFTDGTINLN